VRVDERQMQQKVSMKNLSGLTSKKAREMMPMTEEKQLV